jgi:ParB/RepB/Spo0J family partition protein
VTTFRVFLPESRRRRSPWILVDAANEEEVRRRYPLATRVDVAHDRKQGGTMTMTKEPRLEQLPLAKLKPSPHNPRRDVGDVGELAASIKTVGILEPLLAVQENGHYTLVAGARRLAAAKQAGLAAAPVIVRELDEQERLAAMLIENLHRADLQPLEEAAGYKRLVDEFGLTQRELAAKVGRSQGHVSKRLALLELPKEAVQAVDSGGIKLEEALELTKLRDDPKRQLQAWKQRGQVYGGLPAAVEEELEAKKRDELIAAEEAKLEAKGVRLVRFTRPRNRWDSPELPKGAIEIRKGGGWDELNLEPAAHASEPCHAIAVRIGRRNDGKPELVPVCTDRKRHPKAKTRSEGGRAPSSPTRSEGGRAPSSPSQAQKEANELRKACAARRAFAAIVVQKRIAKTEHTELVLETLINSAHSEVLKVACKLLELDTAGGGFRDFGTSLRAHAGKSALNRERVELAIGFATHEEFMTGPWNGWADHAGYVKLLERHGYQPTAIERKKLPKTAKA